MADIQVYQQLPNFPRFSSVNINYQSNDLYSEGIINQGVDLSQFDYEIIEGFNVIRQKYILKRTGFVSTDPPLPGEPSRIVPEEIFGEFYHYKKVPFPNTAYVTGWEGWIDLVDSNVPTGVDNVVAWDVYQYCNSLDTYNLSAQDLQAFPIEVIYPPLPNVYTYAWIQLQTLAGYNRTEYERWIDGDWNWGEWKYFDFASFAFDPSGSSYGNGINGANGGHYEMRSFPTIIRRNQVNYISLLSGYSEDSRVILSNPTIVPAVSESVSISYYRENKLESIPGLRTIDWMKYEIDVDANIPAILPIIDPVLGTLSVSSLSLKSRIINTQFPTINYDSRFYFEEHLDDLFRQWLNIAILPTRTNRFRLLSANNNVWSNRSIAASDIDYDASHPMFAIDSQRAYDWHIAQQNNSNGIGTLIMDSPRTIEIHTALNAGQYLIESPAVIGTGTAQNPQTPALHKLDWYIKNAGVSDKLTAIWKNLGGDYFNTNRIDGDLDRVTNIGWFVENIGRILGLRRDDNGEIDRDAERLKYRPQTLNNPTLGEASANGKFNGYSTACWGDRGRIMPHLPTNYKNGKNEELYDVYHDIPQQLEMLLRQLDVSLSIQHGSQIRVTGADGKVHSYPNQLSVHLECLQRLEKITYNTDKTLLLSTVTGTELRGLYSGIGIPVTNNFLQIPNPTNGNKSLFIPYFTHQKNKPSIAQSLATVQINLAVINGVLMPKKQPKRDIYNPFKKFEPENK